MIRSIRYLSALLVTVWLSATLFAQWPDHHTRHFDESFGLLSNPTKVIRDHDGFVWILYNNRVQRFDGKNVKDFFPAQGLHSVFCDAENHIWVNNTDAVFLFKDEHTGFMNVPFDTTGNINIRQAFQLPGQSTWLFTSRGFFKKDPLKNVFIKADLPGLHARYPLNTEGRRFSTIGNALFFKSGDTVYNYNLGSGSLRGFLPKNVVGIYGLNNDKLIYTVIGNTSYVYDFSTGVTKQLFIDADKTEPRDAFVFIEDVQQIDTDRYYLATHSGLVEYSLGTDRCRLLYLYHKGRLTEQTDFYQDVYLDQEKKVWIVQASSGLISFDPFYYGFGLIRNNIDEVKKAWPNSARNFVEDEKGNLWMSTSRGFGYLDLQTSRITMYPHVQDADDRLNNPSIRGLIYDGRNLIMGTTRGGVWLYDPARKVYSRPVYEKDSAGIKTKERLENTFIRFMMPLPGKKYLITGSNGTFTMDENTYLVKELRFSGSRDNLFCAYLDRKKRVWIGSTRELHCLDSNLNYINTIRVQGAVNCITDWKDDRVFVGTARKGLTCAWLEGDSIRIKKETSIFDDLEFRFIVSDSTGQYWISTDGGLFRYSPEEKKAISFDYSDNIQGNLYHANSNFRHSNGLLFLGGYNGINFFYPEKIKGRLEKPQPVITSVIINENDSSYNNYDSSFQLKYFQKSLEVNFVAPYFGNTSRLQYRYMLQPTDTNWHNNGNSNSIRFTSLKPGSYEFRVAASLDGTDWYESGDKLNFTIKPPFWQTTWFLIIIIFAIALLATLLYRRRIHYIKQQQSERIEKLKAKQVNAEKELELSNLNHDLAASKLTALRAQMNPHFIFNALNSVQQYMLQGNVTEANKYLSKFSKLQREILNHSDKDFIPLEKELELLNLYLQLEQLRFDETFKYCIQTEEIIDPDEIKIPPMLVQPFVENAIWHGLMPKQGDRNLDIRFQLQDDQLLICTIRDNGIGREASGRFRQSTGNGTKHVSRGLSLVYERLKILEQQYSQTFRVQITDLDEGTLVTLTLYAGH